jgi:hypothetical protein
MNLYFILEGEETELQVYPKWINFILPNYTQVFLEKDVKENNFYVFSGGGIPSIYNHTINAIKDINVNPVFDKLIVCLDGDEIGVEGRINEAKEKIAQSGVILNSGCSIDFVIQNICIETWFLGNRKIVKKIPEGLLLKEFVEHYNVTINDPEGLEKIERFKNKAHFHYSYFREILKEHTLSYKKSNPKIVLEKSFFEELEKRINDTEHLSTFKNFLVLLYEIKSKSSE